MAKIKPTDFSAAVEKILAEFGETSAKAVSKAAEETAKATAQELKQSSPKNQKDGPKIRRGKYARGWKVKEEKSTTIPTYTVHNATDYQLTHLLEYGHVLKKGGRVYGRAKPYPHIAKAEAEAIKAFEKSIRKGIQ